MPGKSILSKDDIVQDSPKDKLREQRIAMQLTQQQVADRAGIKIQQYQKFESGERSIMTASFRVACRVLEALDMDITAFSHGDLSAGEKNKSHMITALKYLKLVDRRGSEEELEKLISIMDPEEIRDLIRTMVPEYRIHRAAVLEDAFMKIVGIGDRKILETVLITLIKGTGETTAPQ